MISLKVLNSNFIKACFTCSYLLLFLTFGCQQKNEGSEGSDGSNLLQGVSKNTFFGSKKFISKIISNDQEDFFNGDSLVAFYKQRKNSPIWGDPELRKDFILQLKKAEEEGLYYKDYHGQLIDSLEKDVSRLNKEEKSKYDIILTDAFFRFSTHLLNGKTDPQKIHRVFDLPKNQADLTSLLTEAVSNKNLEGAFQKIRPNHPIYNQLISSLKIYKEKKEDFNEFKPIESGDLIKPDMQDPRLPKIKFRLMALGYLDDIDPFSYNHSLPVQDAIKQLQLDNGLLADGVIGNSTIKLLNIDYKDRFDQILANLERWRWYPRNLGDHYILINIANYHLDVVKEDTIVRSHKIIVGRNTRKTPIFSEEVKHIIFNPTWTVPPTIKSNDVIPGVRKNPDYLASKHLNVFDSKGNKLNPSEINWGSSSVYSYTYMQYSGGSNPLGVVKIAYPNKYIIYLHDTPSKDQFNKNSRALSSGCIRVQDALALAQYLLWDQPEYSSEKIQEIINSRKTKEVRVSQRVKVYHLYWTAWMENEKPKFTDDIYNYDQKIISALNNFSKP